MSRELITIGAGPLRVEIAPADGGRLAQITCDGTELLVARDQDTHDPFSWGCYPMVPWAGRVRRGAFAFRGRTYALPISMPPHAIHGIGLTSRWAIGDITESSAELSLDMTGDVRWPFGGTITQTMTVSNDQLDLTMGVTAGHRAMPVSFGWHPWFRKPERLEFHPSSMYRRDDDGIATGELVDVPDGPWDDCFTNEQPVAAWIDGHRVVLTSDCTHWVVFDEPDWATCIEPQTGPPDAFTIEPDVLEPGDRRRARFRLRIDEPPKT